MLKKYTFKTSHENAEKIHILYQQYQGGAFAEEELEILKHYKEIFFFCKKQ